MGMFLLNSNQNLVYSDPELQLPICLNPPLSPTLPYPAEWAETDLEGEDEGDDRRGRNGAAVLEVEGREVLLEVREEGEEERRRRHGRRRDEQQDLLARPPHGRQGQEGARQPQGEYHLRITITQA